MTGNTHRPKSRIFIATLAVCALAPALQAQTDIQTAVTSFLQAWYVEKASPAQLKSFIANDNGFQLQAPAIAPRTARQADPVTQLFTGAFVPPKIGERALSPKSLSDVIEYSPAKSSAVRANPGDIVTNEYAIYKAESLPKGSLLPAGKPAGTDPVANFLYHLTQAYPNKLYVVLYAVKGANMLQETAITYWIQEAGVWKLAAFMGTNW